MFDDKRVDFIHQQLVTEILEDCRFHRLERTSLLTDYIQVVPQQVHITLHLLRSEQRPSVYEFVEKIFFR